MIKPVTFAAVLIMFSQLASAEWFSNSFKVMGTQAHLEFWLDDTDNVDNISEQLIILVQQEMRRISPDFRLVLRYPIDLSFAFKSEDRIFNTQQFKQ